MVDWREQLDEAVSQFRTVATLGGETLAEEVPKIEILPAPHRPPSKLPLGMMAIYAFWGNGDWLKIGKVGPNSQARYTSQHYNPGSANSNLAKSVAKCSIISGLADFSAEQPGSWIKENCHRANLLIPASHSMELLSCLEAFLHLKLRPRFER
jgi:hypothetical protein